MDDLTAWDNELAGAQTAAETDHHKVNLDLSIRRVRQRIDRALDVGTDASSSSCAVCCGTTRRGTLGHRPRPEAAD